MILQGDALRLPLRSGSVHCAITSPPYWGLRRYAAEGHLGLEKSPATYVYKLVRVFREVRRVLRDDGVLWVNLGDAYAGGGRGGNPDDSSFRKQGTNLGSLVAPSLVPHGLKPGDLVGLPFRVVSALQADGWWWRATVIVAKKNPMPESVQGVRWERHRARTIKPNPSRGGSGRTEANPTHTIPQGAFSDWENDGMWFPCPGCPTCSPHAGLILRHGSWRPTTSHEFVFMLSKSQRYWADGEAVREVYSSAAEHATRSVLYEAHGDGETSKGRGDGHNMLGSPQAGRNLRSVLSLATQPYAWAMCKGCQEIYSPERFRRLHRDNGQRVCRCGAKGWLSHYAAFPEALVEPLIKASTSEKGCCPTCGAGWARVVERTGHQNQREAAHVPGNSATKTDSTGWRPTRRATETWRSTCACPPHAPVPAIVLDPFSGSGTVCFVAAKLGRKGLGVDLSWEYSRMAVARIAKGESWDPPAVPEAQMRLGV